MRPYRIVFVILLGVLLMSACGGDSAPLATFTPAPTSTPKWLNSGGVIAYTSGIEHNIILRDLDTNRLDVVGDQVLEGAATFVKSLVWSPDGSQLAFDRQEGENVNIYLMDRTDYIIQQVTHGEDLASAFSFPSWSPGGLQLAVVKGLFGADIFILDLASGDMQQITDTDATEHGLAWSPDGMQFAFHTTGDKGLFIMNVDGTGRRQVVGPEVASPRDPDWSPDGSRLAFSSGETSAEDIFIINADGSGLRQSRPGGGVGLSARSWRCVTTSEDYIPLLGIYFGTRTLFLFEEGSLS